ncbi:hypothetical protein HHL16_16855 [Pseudoflavitalea sp. G-6-1-2]|uniref:tail fiber domain-containing protein n=1 Tax=Pseudoflavitalea sp. G-6-1-2 TaxID=2728841 RepID=UPI00146EE884|nr:tail fiber domain-containing protein [Pseudoflavitalea sp. G-6-1-2]NML22554.1 hypothetical protein [Pseudoflavitalea sp. G-6-1-2]
MCNTLRFDGGQFRKALSAKPNRNAYFRQYRSLAGTLAMAMLLIPALLRAQVPDTLAAFRDASLNTRMSLHVNGGLFVGGDFDGNPGKILAEGAGTRMLWYPEKAAFRAGQTTGTFWDDANIGSWSLAIGEDTRASADNAVAFGKRCVAAQVSSFAVGEQNTASGAASVAMGYHAHTNARQGSFVFADRSTVDTLRAGVNHSANWRVSGGFRIFTASNLSTGVTLQSGASVSNWGQSNAVISTSTGAYLSTSGVWTNTSDVHRKRNFQDISDNDILARICRLPIKSWNYKTENDQIRHIGPTAQDFYAAFGLGTDEKAIGTVDADGVALAGIQALDARTNLHTQHMKTLASENELLQQRLTALEKIVASGKNEQAGLSIPLFLLIAGVGIGLMLGRKRRSASAR